MSGLKELFQDDAEVITVRKQVSYMGGLKERWSVKTMGKERAIGRNGEMGTSTAAFRAPVVGK